ncbi:hypothetical protein Zmor_010379 [Zophobas morio]|uniref:Uncharacterized protein n=1 Tax=Zophobas morio TaxID=2755281 RepID=A0AA38IK65_9CUCU|nr:hypothetical protein Zmor_010379 [Zophobas morio]
MDEHDDGRRRRCSRSERRRRSTQEKDARCVARRSTPRSPSSIRNRRRQVEEQSPLARRQSLDRRRSGEECGTTTVSMSVADLSEAIAQGMDRMAGKLRRHTGNEQALSQFPTEWDTRSSGKAVLAELGMKIPLWLGRVRIGSEMGIWDTGLEVLEPGALCFYR